MALVKTWERQFGAEVNFNVQEMVATLTLKKPQKIDFNQLVQGAKETGFTVKDIELRTTGQVVSSRCEICAKNEPFLKIDGTEQQVELHGGTTEAIIGRHIRVVGQVVGWPGDHMAIEVSEWEDFK